MKKEKDGGFVFLDGFPKDVVAFEAKGHIDAGDYANTLVPEIEARLGQQGKVKLLYVLGPAFTGFSAGAAWDDAKLGLKHIGNFPRIAVVSDKDWIRAGTRMFAPLVGAEVEVYRMEQLDEARAWISRNLPEVETKTEVEADYKIPPLEDKMPPLG